MSLKFENPKDPADVAPYSFDWTTRVTADLTIDHHIVRVVTGEETIVEDTNSDLIVETSQVLGAVVVAMLGGGTPGSDYRVECEVTLSNGERYNRESRLKVKNL